MHRSILRCRDQRPQCGHGQDANEGRGGRSIKKIGGRGTEYRGASTRIDSFGCAAKLNAERELWRFVLMVRGQRRVIVIRAARTRHLGLLFMGVMGVLRNLPGWLFRRH